jgi:hypothetical protein
VRRRTLTALALAVAALLLAPAASQAGLKAIWGPLEFPDGGSTFPTYQDLGVDVLQYQLNWSQVAAQKPRREMDPNDPAYRWPAALDEAVRTSRSYGFRIALMVKGSPRWANGGKPSYYAPTKLRAYARFVAAAARRYGPVKHWMIWGEPHRPKVFEPLRPWSKRAPRTYARMLDLAYGALKRVRKSNVVIGGMTFTFAAMPPIRFLRWMRLPNGKPPRLDWFGHNPFSARFPALWQDTYHEGVRDFSDLDTYLGQIRRMYAEIHRKPKIWISEFTVLSDHGHKALSFSVSRDEQARWLSAAYDIVRSHPTWFAGLGWFNLEDSREEVPLRSGLLDENGVPKPAYWAYRRAR